MALHNPVDTLSLAWLSEVRQTLLLLSPVARACAQTLLTRGAAAKLTVDVLTVTSSEVLRPRRFM